MSLLALISVIVFHGYRLTGQTFQCMETWEHNLDISGRVHFSTITPDGKIVGSFFKMGPVMIHSGNAAVLCRHGQGPSELQDLYAFCTHPDGIAFVELPFRIKVFMRKGEKYVWKKTQWLERSQFYTNVSAVLYSSGHWLIGGYFLENFSRKPLYKEVYLKIYDDQGKYVKGLIRKTTRKANQHHLMDYYLVDGGENIFFLAENRLRVTVIHRNKLEIQTTVDLEPPPCYRSMPESYYIFKQ